VKAGDVVNGYLILEDFKVVGAGLSKWTYAERGGRQYFIKEFLSPTYPDDAAPGSEKTKARKRARCATFEAQHRGMQKALAPLSAYGGNLIVTLDFFRAGAKYYKVTEKVDAEDLGPAGVAGLDPRWQLVLMKSVAHSLKILHDLRIVHGDLKPSNILVKRTELGYTSKLIDFDSSYIAGSPPPFEEIVGTINYYSPELLGYIQDVGVLPSELGVASDIFALGLIYAEFLTGAVPPFDAAAYHEPAVAVRSGETLHVPPTGLAPALVTLIDSMLLADPARRPTIAQVHAALMAVRAPSDTAPAAPTGLRSRVGAPVARPAPVTPAPAAVRPAPAHAPAAGPGRAPAVAPSSGLRGKGLKISAATPPAAPAGGTSPATAEPAEAKPSGLVGKLVGRLTGRTRG
jgi:serine/threonine protein kinase